MERTFNMGFTSFHDNPCKDCRRRHEGCHGDCPVYRENKKAYLKRRDAELKENQITGIINKLNKESIEMPRRKEKFNWRNPKIK